MMQVKDINEQVKLTSDAKREIKLNGIDESEINKVEMLRSHGQLHVACSRVGQPSTLFIYAPENKTKNVVYQKALQ